MSALSGRRIAIVSRLFAPEPAAASFRLGSLARELRDAGAQVTVFTSTAPKGTDPTVPGLAGVRVRRAPVLRDKSGYVRGYVHYMTFDVPIFFRMLLSRRFDGVVIEPPPTTGAFMRVATALRRSPYVYYAADVWSDAIELTGSPGVVAKGVRLLERFAYQGAGRVAAVSQEFADRIAQIAPSAAVSVVGNGFDETQFGPDGPARSLSGPYLLYAGTASEVHGAGIFLDAMPKVLAQVPDAQLVFVGQGADRAELERKAATLPAGTVRFEPRLPAADTAEWIRGAAASLASMRPEGRYRAFPAKMHASVGCGTPVVYTGIDPGYSFAKLPGVGWAVDYDIDQVADAMIAALQAPRDEAARAKLAGWARDTVSLKATSARVAQAVVDSLRRR